MTTKIIQLALTMSLFIALLSCSGSGKIAEKAEDIGHQTFAIMEDLEDLNEEQFRNYFLSVEEIKEISKGDNIGERAKKYLQSISKEDIKDNCDNTYEEIAKIAKKEKINWWQIEYEDFQHRVKTDDGLKMCYGELIFSYKDNLYSIETISYLTKDGYGLVRMATPKKFKYN